MRLSTLALMIFAVGCVPTAGTQDNQGAEPWVAPENSWPLATPPEGAALAGFDVGMTVPDLRLIDQFGDEVSLWQFYGNVVWLDLYAMWCISCFELAEHTEETAERFAGDGFVYVTVLQQTIEGKRPVQEDLDEWVDFHGITSPVTGDPSGLSDHAFRGGLQPAALVIDRDLTIAGRMELHSPEVVQDTIAEMISR